MQKQVYEFISKQTQDPIIERRTCHWTGEQFPIFQGDVDMLAKLSPMIGGKKYDLPLPTLSPHARRQRRFMFRNERTLYKRKCDLTGQNIVSSYSDKAPFPVYSYDARRSDKRDGLDYGKDIDPSKSVFQQIKELRDTVPQITLYTVQNENSEYSNFSGWNKNCYLSYSLVYSDTAFYSYRTIKDEYAFDSFNVIGSNNIYEASDTHNSSLIFNADKIFDAAQCYFSLDMMNVQGSLFSTNKRSGIWVDNKQVDYNTFKTTLASMRKQMKSWRWYQELLHRFEGVKQNAYKKNLELEQIENSIGNYIYNAKNMFFGFYVSDIEEGRYSSMTRDMKTIMDVDYDDESEKSYECISTNTSNHQWFCVGVRNSHYSFYSMNCDTCSHIFACVGLKHKEYCIFNKQYSKEEWEQKVGELIERMKKPLLLNPLLKGEGDISFERERIERGEFFAPSLSPFPYNDTIAQEYYPLEQKQAQDLGCSWRDYMFEINIPEGIKTLSAEELPDDIDDGDEHIYQQAIICTQSGRPFRIMPPELAFYKKHWLALPRFHPDVRHQHRIQQGPGRKLCVRKCDKCGVEMLSVYKNSKLQSTSWKQNKQQKVYCEDCYKREVYG